MSALGLIMNAFILDTRDGTLVLLERGVVGVDLYYLVAIGYGFLLIRSASGRN